MFGKWFIENEFFKKHWKELLLIILIAYFLFLNYLIIAPLKQLPSPLYGGDYYYQLGSIYHISQSSFFDWFKSSNILGALPLSMPLYGILVSLLVWIFKFEPILALFVFSFLIIILSALLIYIFVVNFFKNKYLGLIAVSSFFPVIEFPIIKYTPFTKYVGMILFLISLYHFYNNINLKNSIFLGIAYAFATLSHQVAFITVNWILFFFFIYFIIQFFKNRKVDINVFKFFAIAFVIGFSISLIYWFKPIFVFHGKTKLDDQEWTMPSFSFFNVQLEFLLNILKKYYFNLSSIYSILFSLFALIGTFILIFNESKNKEISFLKILLTGSLTLVFSYFITERIIGTNLVPMHHDYFILSPTMFFIGLLGFKFITSKLNKKIFFFTFIILIFFFLFNGVLNYKQKQNDVFYQVGKKEIEPHLKSLQNWILKNTNVNDVILSTNEISFAINALTGRKVLLARRAHNDKFLDFDQLQLDGALILYGNNTDLKLQLIKKYKIKYLYWDRYWFQSEYYFDNEGKIIGWFDPITLRFPEKYEKILQDNGIKYFKKRTWLDPAVKGDNVIKYDLLFISPENYRSPEKPWKKDLDSYLEEVWNFEEIAILYRIKWN